MANTSPQNNHGSTLFAVDTASHLISATAATGAGGVGINALASGDLSSATQLCLGFWYHKTADTGSGNANLVALSRVTTNGANAVVVARMVGDALYFYSRDDTATTLRTTFFDLEAAVPAGNDVFVFYVVDSNNIDGTAFPTASGTSHQALYTWDETNGVVLRAEATTFAAGAAFGQDRDNATDNHAWRVGDSSTGNDPYLIRDVFVFDDLTNLTEDVLVEIAQSKKSPMSVDGCIRWWPLDGAGAAVVSDSATVTDGDLELRDIAGDILNAGGLTLTTAGTAPTYSATQIGPVVASATDPVIDHTFSTLLQYGNTGLATVLQSQDYDLVHFGDSFAAQLRPYTLASAILANGLADFPVVGLFQGLPQVGANNNYTFVLSNLATPAGVSVYNVAASAGTYDNTYFQDGTPALYGFPTMTGGVELYNGTAGTYSPTISTLTVRDDLFKSNGLSSQQDWFETGDHISTRIMSVNYTGIDWNLDVGGAGELATTGNCALARWSAGESPYTDGPNALTTETYFWWDSVPTLEVLADADQTFALDSSASGIAVGTWAHLTGASVHKTDASGNPLPGVNLIAFNIVSADDDTFTSNANPGASNLKSYTDAQLLEVWDGACWGAGRKALVVYDIADSDTWDPATFVSKIETATAAIGYSSVHFLFVSQFMHSETGEDDLYATRQNVIDREASYLTFASGRSDCTVLGLFGAVGGALPGGYSFQADRFEPIGGGNNFGGYPLREQRASLAAHAALGLTLGANSGAVLDVSNLHRNSGGTGQADAELLNGYWIGQALQLAAGGNRSRDRSRLR